MGSEPNRTESFDAQSPPSLGGMPIGQPSLRVRSSSDELRRLATAAHEHVAEYLCFEQPERAVFMHGGGDGRPYDAEAYQQGVIRPARELIGRGGHRWRPLLSMLLLRCLHNEGSQWDPLVSVLCELPHTGSLIVDDVEDGSLTRRGGPAIHVLYGRETAINCGNSLYFLAFQRLQAEDGLNARRKIALYDCMTKLFVRAHIGQSADLGRGQNLANRLQDSALTEDAYRMLLQSYDKTAAAAEFNTEIAAILAATPPDVRTALCGFGHAIGISYQLLDDVRNFSAAPEHLARRGEDLRAGKLTAVIFEAMRRLDESLREQLRNLLLQQCERSVTQGRAAEEMLADGIALVEQSGAVEAVQLQAEKYFHDGWRQLCTVVEQSAERDLLEEHCHHLLGQAGDAIGNSPT